MAEATAKIVELTEENTCKICDNAHAKYVCPRCNILYCSLTCYQSTKHLQCSESFYKDCVTEQLTVNKTEEEAKRKIHEILNRHRQAVGEQLDGNIGDFCGLEHENSASDDEDDDDDNLAERFKDIDLDAETADDIWSRLKKDEQQDFLAFLRSGDVSKLVPSWEPWWTYHDDKKVREVDQSDQSKYENCPKLVKIKDFKKLMDKNCPKLVKIKDFKQLMAKPPFDCVKYNLINILASYALMARYFNGEYSDFGKEVVSCLINNSLTLKSNHNFEDFETAVKSVQQECMNVDWITVDAENIIKMKEDVHHILKGPENSNKKFYILCALSDIYKLMRDSLEKKEKEDPDAFVKKVFPESVPKVKLESEARIRQSLRKIEYFLSYAKDCFSYD